MNSNSLHSITNTLMANPKGLLAADESNKSICKRFLALNIDCNEDSRRHYRQLLFSTPNIAQYISGIILYDETIRQSNDHDVSFVKSLTDQGIIPGIKVDKGLVDLTNFAGETTTEGLDDLATRLREYYSLGARFTKWRAAFAIDELNNLPSSTAIHANIHSLARYVTLVQAAGMVPIVEPEVLYDGQHSIKSSQEVTSQVLRILFDTLKAYRVDLSGIILKTSMVLAGKANPHQSKPEEVAKTTLQVLKERVPEEIGGIVFLSGGQSPTQATNNLNAIGLAGPQPWPISFSFSRAVQEPALNAWQGKSKNIRLAQNQFIELLRANSEAREGKYLSNNNLTK